VDGEFLLEVKILGKIACEQSSAQGELARVRSEGAGGYFEEGGFAATITAHHPDALSLENSNGA
jgi:hypothetical protein